MCVSVCVCVKHTHTHTHTYTHTHTHTHTHTRLRTQMLEQIALGVKGSIVPIKFPWARKPDDQDAALAAIFHFQVNGALTAKDVR
jgi:hypothetical protein